MKFAKIGLAIFSMMLVWWGCRSSDSGKNFPELSKQLQTLVDTTVSPRGEDPIHSVVLLVQRNNFKWKGAAGFADGQKELMTSEHKIKIASITKTFTATLILQLVEEGMINLEDPIAKYLDNSMVKPDSLHLFENRSYGRQITVKQLLTHTSGIKDYMEDPRFIPGVIENPDKQYSPAEIMGLYYRYQTNRHAVFPPGTDFDYSDVNYVLLAMIIENVTGKTYHSQLTARIFEPLEMENSYLEYYEAPRGAQPLSHPFFSTLDLVSDVNTSFDWGGGGIVSTVDELNVFFRALLDGQLFSKRSTLTLMIGEADKGLGGMDYDYGMGIMKRQIHGMIFYGHGGAYDCDAFYCPQADISVVMSLNQMNTHGKRDPFLFQAVELVK